jgi:hypothetical protein
MEEIATADLVKIYELIPCVVRQTIKVVDHKPGRYHVAGSFLQPLVNVA